MWRLKLKNWNGTRRLKTVLIDTHFDSYAVIFSEPHEETKHIDH